MVTRLVACAALLTALGSAQPAFAADAAAPAAASTQDEMEEIKISLFSHRRSPNLYWRIDARGKGEVSTPEGVGYQTAKPLLPSPDFRFAPGVHTFDIGEDGYRALRANLAEIIDGKVDPYEMTDGACLLRTVTHSGTAELDWKGQKDGQLHLAHECLNGTGQYFHDRMVLSWHKLASLLQQRGAPFVEAVREPALRIPRTLRFTETNIWGGSTTNWQIGANGAGWIEFSADGNLPTLSISETNFVKAGRYQFRIDRDFHQSILRELDPYLSGAKTVGSCEDEIDTSDQPLVRIEWQHKSGKPAKFASDLGCPSFAARFGKVKLAFAELLLQGSIGNSKMLNAAGSRK